MYQNLGPMEIEQKSFEIITSEMGNHNVLPENELVLKRVIHTSADFDYMENLVFSEGAVASGIAALKAGVTIITDTNMAKSGVNKTIMAKLGGKVECFVADEDVAKEAKERGVTRSIVAMEKAVSMYPNGIFVMGNAPTALIRLLELVKEGKANPSLVVGVPVGFVNVVESKDMIIEYGKLPYIIAKGRKGGSNVAAAICNAMIYQIER